MEEWRTEKLGLVRLYGLCTVSACMKSISLRVFLFPAKKPDLPCVCSVCAFSKCTGKTLLFCNLQQGRGRSTRGATRSMSHPISNLFLLARNSPCSHSEAYLL